MAKEKSGKSFSQIGKECGLTNVYTASLFYNQVRCTSARGPSAREARHLLIHQLGRHLLGGG